MVRKNIYKSIATVLMILGSSISAYAEDIPVLHIQNGNDFYDEQHSLAFSNIEEKPYIAGYQIQSNGVKTPVFNNTKDGYEAKVWFSNGYLFVHWKHYQSHLDTNQNFPVSRTFNENTFQSDFRKTIGIPNEHNQIFLNVSPE